MPMSDESEGYQSYLLRLWRARCQGEWQWRASLESRHTAEHQVFGSLEQVFAFLNARCVEQARRGEGVRERHGDGKTRGESGAPEGFEI